MPYDPTRPKNPWTQTSSPIEGADEVHVLVLSGYGLNCEDETSAAFAALGAQADIVHVAEMFERGDAALDGVNIIVFTGGFSFGDHIASGRVLANRVRFALGDRIARFVDDGGLVLGICNGFQTIVKLGLLPAVGRASGEAIAPQQASVVYNERLGYRNAWVRLRLDPDSPCVFTRGASGEILELPSRHGEGKLLLSPEVQAQIEAKHLVPLRYVDVDGEPTLGWPANPNGSPNAAAGLCDASGRVFGLMPHPEAYAYPTNHPDWIEQRDTGTLPAQGFGLGLLANGVRAVL